MTPQTVTKWRKKLDVGRMTAGTTELKREHFSEPWAREAHAKAGDPERRAKIAAARRGKPRPAHVVVWMRQRMRGTKLSAETRQKMSATRRARRAQRSAGAPSVVDGTRVLAPPVAQPASPAETSLAE